MRRKRTLVDRVLKLGVSVDEFAQANGLHRDYVYKLSRGMRTPSVATGQRIAGALGLSFDELLKVIQRG